MSTTKDQNTSTPMHSSPWVWDAPLIGGLVITLIATVIAFILAGQRDNLAHWQWFTILLGGVWMGSSVILTAQHYRDGYPRWTTVQIIATAIACYLMFKWALAG